MIFGCMYEKLWTVLCLFDLRFQSLCDCLPEPNTVRSRESHPKGCARSAHQQDPLQESHAGANNPVGINETVVRNRRTNLTRGFAITAMTMRWKLVFGALQNGKTPRVQPSPSLLILQGWPVRDYHCAEGNRSLLEMFPTLRQCGVRRPGVGSYQPSA
jgi:hypothetical protein